MTKSKALGAVRTALPDTALAPKSERGSHMAGKVAAANAPAKQARSHASSYVNLVKQLAKERGVRVAAVPVAMKNPYRLASPEAAEKVLREAGILTRAGKLSSRFK